MNAFDDCVKKGRLKKIETDAERVAQELSTAQEEIEQGRAYYEKGNWGGVVVQAYFAMSHGARGALASQGFRDTNFYALCVGIQQLFVEPGDLQPDTVKEIRTSKEIKDGVYNRRKVTPEEARRSLASALVFVHDIFARLALPGFDAEKIDKNLPEENFNRADRDEDDWRSRRGREHSPQIGRPDRQPSNEARRWRSDDPRRRPRDWGRSGWQSSAYGRRPASGES